MLQANTRESTVENLPLLCGDDSILLIVDMQAGLAKAMPAGDWTRARDATIVMVRAAAELDIPIATARQYPKGLGSTAAEIEAVLPPRTEQFDKTCFSACGAEGLFDLLKLTERSQIVVCGMEAHVCVLQTAADLVRRGYRPFVVGDATSSRNPAHGHNALERMRAHGIAVINHESAVFEWLRDARHEHFKTLLELLR